jgi:hypothetical protein
LAKKYTINAILGCDAKVRALNDQNFENLLGDVLTGKVSLGLAMGYVRFDERVILDGDEGMSELEIQFDRGIKKMKDKFKGGERGERG